MLVDWGCLHRIWAINQLDVIVKFDCAAKAYGIVYLQKRLCLSDNLGRQNKERLRQKTLVHHLQWHQSVAYDQHMSEWLPGVCLQLRESIYFRHHLGWLYQARLRYRLYQHLQHLKRDLSRICYQRLRRQLGPGLHSHCVFLQTKSLQLAVSMNWAVDSCGTYSDAEGLPQYRPSPRFDADCMSVINSLALAI